MRNLRGGLRNSRGIVSAYDESIDVKPGRFSP